MAADVIRRLRQQALAELDCWSSGHLACIRLYSWCIPGIGRSPRVLLESQRLCDAGQRRRHIDQLTKPPGIGIGLQTRLVQKR